MTSFKTGCVSCYREESFFVSKLFVFDIQTSLSRMPVRSLKLQTS